MGNHADIGGGAMFLKEGRFAPRKNLSTDKRGRSGRMEGIVTKRGRRERPVEGSVSEPTYGTYRGKTTKKERAFSNISN